MVLVGYDRRHREGRGSYRNFFDSPTQCMIELGEPCAEAAIKGHVIPASRLRLLADSRNRVVTSITDSRKRADQSHISKTGSIERPSFSFDSRNISNYLFTRRMACQRHDNDLFRIVEDQEIDWNDSRSLTILTYRSLLSQIFIDHYKAFIHNEIFFTTGIEMTDPVSDRKLLETKRDLERMIHENAYEPWEFKVFQFEIHPAIAASGVILRGFTWDEYGRLGNNLILPFDESNMILVPIIITVYPGSNKQSAVISYPKWAMKIARIIVDALNQEDEFIRASMLSRSLIEETEVIIVSTELWNAFGADKQRAIEMYFEMSTPWSPGADMRPDIDPRIFDLFGFFEREQQNS